MAPTTMTNVKLYERVAVLETNVAQLQETMDSVSVKLDNLLELKAKGMGAIGLVSLILGSGVIGLITLIVSFFKGSGGVHL